ncbi:MAG: NifB/NifX family molybdenum-iron cluster-binding protein [Bacteroidales bacterium]|nr:NifB/NifX family molybdenum-iron cluster-binding protein [Bacteroidales bacterium]
MKTIISSTGKKLESGFDLRFGRAEWFCLLDEETGETTFHENENKEASHGAGTKAVEKVIELGASKIISGDFGPKAKELLEKFNIQMVLLSDDSRSIADIIDRIK